MFDELDNATYNQSSNRFAVYRQVARYYVVFLVVFGSLGNGTCLIIYRRASLNRCRRVQYLTALAVSDLVFLFCLGLTWLQGVGVRWYELPGVCATSIYASNTASFLSGWYVMVLTAEMACVLRRPYHIVRTTVGGCLTVAKRIVAISLMGCLLNSWTLFVMESVQKSVELPANEYYYEYYETENGTDNSSEVVMTLDDMPMETSDLPDESGYICRIDLNSKLLYNAFTVFDMVASFSVPLVVTFLLNIYIACAITQAARQRRQLSHHQLLSRLRAKSKSNEGHLMTMLHYSPLTSRTSRTVHQHPPLSQTDSNSMSGSLAWRRSALKPNGNSNVLMEAAARLRRVAVRQRLRAESTVSSLLVAKSLTYLVLNLPNYVHRIWLIVYPQNKSKTDMSEFHFLVQMIVYLSFYTQYALNFVIYSGNAFVRNVWGRRSRASATTGR